MIRQAQRGDAAPGRQYQCNTNVCQVFALRPHTNQRIRRDNATLAPVAPACLRRPASLPASLPASGDAAPVSPRRCTPRRCTPRRWPVSASQRRATLASQRQSAPVRATRRQVSPSQGNGKAKENKGLRQVRAAVRGWIGCADPPRGPVGGGQDDFDTPTGRQPEIFCGSKFFAHQNFCRKIFLVFQYTTR